MSLQRSLGGERAGRARIAGTEELLSRYRFTVEDYHAMARAGILSEDDRVELLDGEIVEKMTIGSRHAACVDRLNRLFVQRLGDRVVVRVQNPIQLDDYSEPEPDLSLLRPKDDFYAEGHPMPDDVHVVIEVADASLGRDRIVKVPLYAAAGVREVWIVNLQARQVEVFRQPSGDGYREIRLLEDEPLSPLAFPELELAAEDIVGP